MRIDFEGATLDIHPLLANAWPKDLPSYEWPTFCGAGSGIGDKIVPETICDVSVSCCCADHDIRWSIADDTWSAAIAANWIFYQNLSAFVWANCDREKYFRAKVESICFWWFLAVCWGARHFFSPVGGGDKGNAEVTHILEKISAAEEESRKKANIWIS
jgi:hypothetical protein